MAERSKAGVRDNAALRAAHPPAVMAGGKRMAKKTSDDPSALEKETRRPVQKPRSLHAPTRMQSVSLLLAGTLEKLGHEFPATPVSVRHSKVRPAVEKLHSPKTFVIQQPRKC